LIAIRIATEQRNSSTGPRECQQIFFEKIFFASARCRFLDGERRFSGAEIFLKIALDARAADREFFQKTRGARQR
jgi:hypothetical protein